MVSIIKYKYMKANVNDIVSFKNRKWLWFTTFDNGKAFLILEKGEKTLFQDGKDLDRLTTSIKNLTLVRF